MEGSAPINVARMGRLDRYLFSMAAIAFLAVLGSLTTMVWLTQVLRRFDLLATQGQSLMIFLTVTGLALPMLMLVIAPIALFIAVVFTLNRLNADSELIVMSAAGVSRWQIFRLITLPLLRPTTVFVVVITLLNGFQSFVYQFLITRGGPNDSTNVLGYLIYEEAFPNLNMGRAAAISMVLFAMLIVLTFIQLYLLRQRYE